MCPKWAMEWANMWVKTRPNAISHTGCSASCILDSEDQVVTAEDGEGGEGGASSSTVTANEASKASVLKKVSKTPSVATPLKPVEGKKLRREGVEDSNTEGSFVADSLPKGGDVACSSDTRKRKRIDHLINVSGGLYTFRINGQNYHRIGYILPKDDTQPRYAQLWFFDTQNKIRNMLGAFIEQETGEGADGTIVGSLIEMLDQNSCISKAFRMARDCVETRIGGGRDEKKRLDHLKQDQEMLVIKIFSERKKCEKIRAKRDCMMVVRKIVSRLLEEVEKLEWWFKQDIDDEEEDDEEGEGGGE
ncbi:hypothetical protein Tco_1410179, partial [Tanacetum coccineum]